MAQADRALVTLERDNGVGVVTLARPEKHNALSRALLGQLVARIEEVNADPALRVAILRAEGPSFSVGDDLEEMLQGAPREADVAEVVGLFQDVTRAIMFSDVIHIGAVDGLAVGGAFSWLLNCDVTFLGPNAQGFLPEAKHGLFLSGGLSLLLPRRVGAARAMSWLLSGRRISAQELIEAGVGLAAPNGAAAAAAAFAAPLVEYPPRALAAFKGDVRSESREDLERALAVETKRLFQSASDPELLTRIAAALRKG
ncbi:MAG: enoyl-CoA hydratase/isomerase family protein [Pseudomonadota bacterium]